MRSARNRSFLRERVAGANECAVPWKPLRQANLSIPSANFSQVSPSLHTWRHTQIMCVYYQLLAYAYNLHMQTIIALFSYFVTFFYLYTSVIIKSNYYLLVHKLITQQKHSFYFSPQSSLYSMHLSQLFKHFLISSE
jgi:hypothetical protein